MRRCPMGTENCTARARAFRQVISCAESPLVLAVTQRLVFTTAGFSRLSFFQKRPAWAGRRPYIHRLVFALTGPFSDSPAFYGQALPRGRPNLHLIQPGRHQVLCSEIYIRYVTFTLKKALPVNGQHDIATA